MQQKVATIREVQTKDTSKGTLFTVLTTDGEDFATFNAGTAHQARGLTNRPSLITFNEKQVEKNGTTFTNRWFEGAEPWDGATPGATPPQQRAPQQLSSARDEKSMQIMRQCGTKVAVAMLPYMDDAPSPGLLIDLSEWLVGYYLDGRIGVTSRNDIDPGPTDRPPLGDDDIPSF